MYAYNNLLTIRYQNIKYPYVVNAAAIVIWYMLGFITNGLHLWGAINDL